MNFQINKWLILAITLISLLFPIPASAAYTFSDGFNDFDEYGNYFHRKWRTSDEPDEPLDPYQRGHWEIGFEPKFKTYGNDLTKDPTFAGIIYESGKSILYYINNDSDPDYGLVNSKNYQLTAVLSAGDIGSLGVVFYYQDENNYYRLTINNNKFGATSSYGDADSDALIDYPHSIFLTRRANGEDELLAIAPWPETQHEVKPFYTVTLRVKVITDETAENPDHKYILAQYLNPRLGDYVNLFDKIHEDTDTTLNYGFAGAFANEMGLANAGGKLHHIAVQHITSINNIARLNPSDDLSDPYLLDYKDIDENESETAALELVQYTPDNIHIPMYWYLDGVLQSSDPTSSENLAFTMDIPLGEHFVSLYQEPDQTGFAGSKEAWVSSNSAFTIAVIPDLHAGQKADTSSQADDSKRHMRDFQIDGIMKEIAERASHEDNIIASIQVGDMAMRGSQKQMTATRTSLSYLPSDMPIIASLGNHDYYGCNADSLALRDRDSQFPDFYVYPTVTSSRRVEAAANPNRNKPGYGVEIPSELDNMYFLFDESDLGSAESGKWLVLSLQYKPMRRDLFWAETILKRYSDYNVILVTHQFLNENGNIDDKAEPWAVRPLHPGCWLLNWYGPPFGLWDSNSPEDFWKFLKKHDQIKLILDGHSSAILAQTIPNGADNDVLTVMTDISYEHSKQGAGGQFRLIEIDPELSLVRGRLVNARTGHYFPYVSETDKGYSSWDIPEQAINATHTDAYFIEEIGLSNSYCYDVRLFEDFNDCLDDCSLPYDDICLAENDCLPDDWRVHDNATPQSNWVVDMTNEPGSLEYPLGGPIGLDPTPETDVVRQMSKFGRVQQTEYTSSSYIWGTYLAYENTEAKKWSNYTFQVDLSPGDNDGIGVMFYYTDDDNYYRFYIYNQDYWCKFGVRCNWFLERIYKGQNGKVREIIAQGEWPEWAYFSQHDIYKFVVDLSEDNKIKIDVYDDIYDSDTESKGNFIHVEKVDSTHQKGTVALYSYGMDNKTWSQAGAIYDNILVTTDSTFPSVEITNPLANDALQDGVTFKSTASYSCGVTGLSFSIREPNGAAGIPIGYENLPATLNASGEWELYFDTTLLLDGYYVIFAKATSHGGKEGLSELVPFSIRNWAVVELLPSSRKYKAGRTMPLKFALRVVESVDPDMPFVYNEDLEIRVYDSSKPGTILQTSHYGDTSRDYRIDNLGELYITNFKTSKKPAEYTVEIWRMNKDWLIGDFSFETNK